MIVVALCYRGSFRISEPFDAALIAPERMAAKLVFWKGRGENTHYADWRVTASYDVDRTHYLGNLPYDRLLFMNHSSEPTTPIPFDDHGSPWLIKAA